MKQFLIGAVFSIAVSLFSCKKDSADLIQHDITSVTGPTSGSANTTIPITVTYPYVNGCDRLGSFGQTVSGNIISIKAFAVPVQKEAICTMDAGFRTIDYNFSAGTAGTYELRFLKTDGSSVNHFVTIQ